MKNLSISAILIALVFAVSSNIFPTRAAIRSEAPRAVFTVTKTDDTADGACDADCSLREAIAAANEAETDDVITFAANVFGATPRTIVLGGTELVVIRNGSLLINGPGAALLTISGNNASRVFSIHQNANVTITGVRITGGNGSGNPENGHGGGIINDFATLNLINVVVSGNAVNTNAGAIAGGIYNFRGTLTLENSVVTGNSATLGGGIYHAVFSGSLTLTNTVVSGNTASFGGGIYTQSPANINNSTIINNSASDNGGGIYNRDVLNLNASTLTSNVASNGEGGGVYDNPSANTTISGSLVTSNTAGSRGGGIASLGTTSVIGSTVSGNVAAAGGGLSNIGTFMLTGSTVSGNSAIQRGGGLLNSIGTLNVTNSTVSGNSVANGQFGGGGIYNDNFGTVNLIYATICFNSAGVGGGVRNDGGTVSGRNALIGDNTAGTAPDFAGILSSQGYNLIENTDGTTVAGTPTGNITGQDALLDPILRNNGGPTRTHALRAGSPAIDKGGAVFPAVTTDQRGLPRPFDFPAIPNAPGGDGSDIGAFERQALEIFRSTQFDFDGDGRADISVFRPSDGVWYLNQSSAGFRAERFGISSDRIVPADYDGDGRADIAVYRDGFWFLLRSTLGFAAVQFGIASDIPRPADFDGDGRAELVVFRPSVGTWYTLNLLTGEFRSVVFGTAGDIPAPADYDGDGRADFAVFRPSDGTWRLLRSTQGAETIQFGAAGDTPVVGDYDGDGRADPAVFSGGVWRILYIATRETVTVQFGLATDLPTPADYDGDRRTDIAVFRNGDWYLLQSTQGFAAARFGLTGDKPIPNAFVTQ